MAASETWQNESSCPCIWIQRVLEKVTAGSWRPLIFARRVLAKVEDRKADFNIRLEAFINPERPTRFPQFSKLPLEIRLQIWNLAIPPRVVGFAHARPWCATISNQRISRRELFLENTLKESLAAIALMKVSGEARATVLRDLHAASRRAVRKGGAAKWRGRTSRPRGAVLTPPFSLPPPAPAFTFPSSKVSQAKSRHSSFAPLWQRRTMAFDPDRDTALLPFQDAVYLRRPILDPNPEFASLRQTRHLALLVHDRSFRRDFCQVLEAFDTTRPIANWISYVPLQEGLQRPCHLDHFPNLESVTIVARKHRHRHRTLGPRARIRCCEVYKDLEWEVRWGGDALGVLNWRHFRLIQALGFSQGKMVAGVLGRHVGTQRIVSRSARGLQEEKVSIRAGVIEDPDAWKMDARHKSAKLVRRTRALFKAVYVRTGMHWVSRACVDCMGRLRKKVT